MAAFSACLEDKYTAKPQLLGSLSPQFLSRKAHSLFRLLPVFQIEGLLSNIRHRNAQPMVHRNGTTTLDFMQKKEKEHFSPLHRTLSYHEKTAIGRIRGIALITKMGACFSMRGALQLSKYGTTGIAFCLAHYELSVILRGLVKVEEKANEKCHKSCQ